MYPHANDGEKTRRDMIIWPQGAGDGSRLAERCGGEAVEDFAGICE
jgi:hypothetical protein